MKKDSIRWDITYVYVYSALVHIVHIVHINILYIYIEAYLCPCSFHITILYDDESFRTLFLLEEKNICRFLRGERLAWQARAFRERETQGQIGPKNVGPVCCCQASYRGPQDLCCDKQWPAVSILVVYQYTSDTNIVFTMYWCWYHGLWNHPVWWCRCWEVTTWFENSYP